MNQNVYNTLNSAREKLFDMQTSRTMVAGPAFRVELDLVAMAVDDALNELDRLRSDNKELRKENAKLKDAMENSRFKGSENYLEFHENRDEIQIKPGDF